MVLHVIRIAVRFGLDLVIRSVVAELRILEEIIDRVEPETIDAAIQPEPQHAFHVINHRRIAVIEIRLLRQKAVHVILLAPRVPGERRAAKHRQPIARRRAIGARVDPDIPVGFGIAAVAAGLSEKRMFVGRMVQHLINDHLQPQAMRPCHQRVKIGQGAKDRIDIGIVRHVIAHVQHRRGEDR